MRAVRDSAAYSDRAVEAGFGAAFGCVGCGAQAGDFLVRGFVR
jgi:hypothetical protein